jgi:hypothetical protein
MICTLIVTLAIAMFAGHLPALTPHYGAIPVACDCPKDDALCKVRKCSGDIGSPVGTGGSVTTSTQRPDETIQQKKGGPPAKPNSQ